MKTELQNKAWACLPKEVRDFIKNDTATAWQLAYARLFGEHNLTSDTEPEEMLMIKRDFVITQYEEAQKREKQNVADNNIEWACQYHGIQMAMNVLFGDKCLPDKEAQNIPKHSNSFQIGKIEQPSVQGEPKFKVGELAMNYGKKCRILDYNPDGKFPYLIHILYNNLKTNVSEFDLEPYTEPSNVSADETKNETKDMEEKELNLCELLKGCEGETFYSDVFELVVLTKVNLVGNFLTINWNRLDLNLYSNGSKVKGNRCVLWPSKELYEKYPLDAYSAWMEWKETRKPKRWRANRDDEYWLIDSDGEPCTSHERFDYHNNANYDFGNYFRTEEEAQQAAEAVRKCLRKFHEKNCKQ